MTATETPPVGRRERKKQRTREALIDAAFELFMAKGFEATTVEEIADAVDVSSRTFFRYFSSKEEVALTLQSEQFEAVLAAVAGRPADEPIFTALRRAAVEVTREFEAGDLIDTQRFQCLMSLTAESPAMMARSLEHAQKKQADLTAAVAARMGVDPDQDLRPAVVASICTGAFRAAADAMLAGTPRYGSFCEAVDDAFRIIEEGVNFPSKAVSKSE